MAIVGKMGETFKYYLEAKTTEVIDGEEMFDYLRFRTLNDVMRYLSENEATITEWNLQNYMTEAEKDDYAMVSF